MHKNHISLKLLFLFPAFIIFFQTATCQPGKNALFVSPTGSDTNAGTLEKPLATLEGAKAKVRSLKAAGNLLSDGITVYFRKGNYLIRETIAFGPEDSGTSQSPITYQNYQGENVSLNGGIEVPAQAVRKVIDSSILNRLPQESKGQVYMVDLRALNITDYGQLNQHGFSLPVRPAPMELFINGKPQTLARWPNEGIVKIGEVVDPGSVPRENDFSNRGGIFKYNYDRANRWQKADDIWLQGIFSWGYADDNLKVDKIDLEKQEIKTVQPHIYSIRSSSDPSGGQDLRGYYVYNLLEEIDLPGEYFIDREEGILYFWPPADFKSSSLTLSVMEEPLLALEDASFIKFSGFTIENARGMGIYMEKGEGNEINECTFRNLGTLGIMMGKGVEYTDGAVHAFISKSVSRQIGNFSAQSYENNVWNREAGKNHLIQGCMFYQLGTGGIILDGGDRKTLTAAENEVTQCEFYDVNRWNKTYNPPIMLRGVGNRVTHNYLHDAPHAAILLSGNNHLIEYNEIARVCQNADDMGAIYMGRNPSERGNHIRYNYFHEIESENSRVTAIYFDDGTGGGRVFGNVFYKTGGSKFGAVFVHGGHDHIFENNVFVECQRAFGNTYWKNQRWNERVKSKQWVKRLRKEVDITQPPYTTEYPELKDFYKPQKPRINKVMNNVAYQCDTFAAPHYDLHDNFITNENPGFEDASHQNFQLKKNAVVFEKAPDFQPVPFEKTGLSK